MRRMQSLLSNDQLRKLEGGILWFTAELKVDDNLILTETGEYYAHLVNKTIFIQ